MTFKCNLKKENVILTTKTILRKKKLGKKKNCGLRKKKCVLIFKKKIMIFKKKKILIENSFQENKNPL